MAEPPTYRANPDAEFADRLERVLLRRLTGEPEELPPDGNAAPSYGSKDTDTDHDNRSGSIVLSTEDRPYGSAEARSHSPRRSLVAAAAAVVVAFTAVGTLLAAGDGDDERVGTATPTPTTADPARDAMRSSGALQGRYFVDPDGDDATPLRVTYRVAAQDWWPWFGAVKYLPGDGVDGFTGLSITTVSNVVSDGCRDHTPLDPPVGPTVDDLAIALSKLAPFEVSASPTDVTLLGYRGKHLELRVPDLRFSGGASKNTNRFLGCDEGELHSWISPINDRSDWLLGHSTLPQLPSFNGYQVPGQTEEFWILDVEGTRLVIVNFDTPGAPAADVAERDAIFDSIRIEPQAAS